MQAEPTQLTHVARVRPSRATRAGSLTRRIALFVCALHGEDAPRLLEGFADATRREAERFARRLAETDSATRQARLACEFGLRADAGDRIKQLVLEASPALRQVIAAQLPAQWRALFPHLPGVVGSEALRQLATRLIREATRL